LLFRIIVKELLFNIRFNIFKKLFTNYVLIFNIYYLLLRVVNLRVTIFLELLSFLKWFLFIIYDLIFIIIYLSYIIYLNNRTQIEPLRTVPDLTNRYDLITYPVQPSLMAQVGFFLTITLSVFKIPNSKQTIFKYISFFLFYFYKTTSSERGNSCVITFCFFQVLNPFLLTWDC
jgi:hypothetical protein